MPVVRNFFPRIVVLLLVAILFSGCTRAAKEARLSRRAEQYFNSGEYDKAKLEYLNVLRVNYQNATGYKQIGFIWMEQGVPLRALPFLLRAQQLSPKDLAVKSKVATAFIRVGNLSETRKAAISILEQDPANLEAIILLSDTSQTKEEIAATEKQLEKFPKKETAEFHLAAASLAARKGELGRAGDELEQAVAANPKSPRVHSAMAYLYALRQNAGRVGSELKMAADLAPVRSQERIKYAEFQAANNAVDEAKASLRNITKQAPDFIPAWFSLAQIAFREKNYDETLSLLENIFGRDPQNPEAQLLQSEAWLGKGDATKAIAILDKLNATYPDMAPVKYDLGRAYLVSKNPTQAAAALEQAVKANPNYAEAIILLAELNLRSGKVPAAVSALEDLLKKRPNLSQARVLLSAAYQALGRLDDAAAIFRADIQKNPGDSAGYLALGLILRQQNKNDEARQAFQKASELAPNNPNSIAQLVEMDVAEKHYNDAMQRVQQLSEKKPEAATLHFLEARIYAAQQDWTRTEAALQKTIELDPNFYPAYERLVSVYLAENRLPQAISEVETILGKNPKNQPILVSAAVLYEKTKDYPKARDAYEKVLALSPDSVFALNNLAILYSEHLGQPDRAYELAQKARQLAPGEGAVADTLGWILYRRGDYQHALELLQESASKVPNDPQVQFHLGMTNYIMGQVEPAREALQKAGEAATDFPDKAEAQRQLSQLKEVSTRRKEASITELETLVKQRPNDPTLLQQLGETYEKQGNAIKAAAAYSEALKINPKLLPVALSLAQVYGGPLNSPDKALEFAKKARELAPNDPQTAGVLGRIAFQSGNFSWAYSVLQESARQRRNNPEILHDLALAAYASGKVTEANQAMQRSVDLAPDGKQTADAKKFLRMTALEQPSPEVINAEPEIQAVLNAEPGYAPGLMAKAAIQLQRNQPNEATKTYLEVLQKYPDFAPAQKRLAIIYAANPAELSKAYDLAIKARKVLSDDPDLARTLAKLNFQRKEFGYAVQLFQESAGKRPLAAEDLYYLGMAQLQTKHEVEGRKTLERSLAAGLKDPLARDAQQRLAAQQFK